jgi:hypothetical protein
MINYSLTRLITEQKMAVNLNSEDIIDGFKNLTEHRIVYNKLKLFIKLFCFYIETQTVFFFFI